MSEPSGSIKADSDTANPGSAESARARKQFFRTELAVRWRDLDAFNHVNNAMYLGYLEEARLRWLVTLDGPWMNANVAPVVASALVNFRRPIAWPEDVVVELFVDRIGNSSLTLGHRILSAKDSTVLYCDGHVAMVWFDSRSGKSAPLPDCVREACASQ
jgi:acyl-CoA thioester hydrolase